MAIYGSLGDIEVSADYPSIQPTLDLNFAKTKALDPRITFYRNSLATYTDDKGIIRTVPENVPRFDHDPTTGESLGLLIEESRTNLMPYSANTVLTSSANVTTSRSTGLDGNPTSALNVTYNSNSGSFVLTANATVSATNTYTFSVYIKKNVNSTSGNAGAAMYSYFNNGTAGQWSGTILNEDGQHLGQAPIGVWKRYSKTITVTSGTGVQITLPGYDTSGLNADYFGAQIELGAFPTSYIPTSGSTATRVGDVAQFIGSNLTNWYSPSEGTWVLDTNKTVGLNNSYAALFYMRPTNSGIGNRNEIYKQSGNSRFTYQYGDNSYTTAANVATTNGIPSGNNKIFAYYKLNDFGVGFNSVIENTDTSGSVQTLTDPNIYLVLGSTGDSEFWNGHFKRFLHYSKRLTNTQLQNLTA